MGRNFAVACACVLTLGSASAESAPSVLGTLKSIRLGMTLAEAGKADETAVCPEPGARIASCLLYITVAQVPSNVALTLVTTAARAELVIPKAPAAPQYEDVPALTSSDLRNGLTVAVGAAEAVARNAEKKRRYGERLRGYEAAKRDARARFEAQFKVARIHVSFRSDQHGAFRQAYIAKFGQPATSKQMTYRNAMNASFEGIEDQWSDASVEVRLYQRCESIDQSCLVVEAVDLAPYVRAANEADIRDRVEDL